MSATSNFKGFQFSHILGAGAATPTIQKMVTADAALAKGDFVNQESGQVDLGVTNDTTFLGVVQETKSGMTTGTTTIEVITDRWAVYAVVDNNARTQGDTLDLSGATGAQTVASSSNADFLVVATSTADELTHVIVNQGEHQYDQ